MKEKLQKRINAMGLISDLDIDSTLIEMLNIVENDDVLRIFINTFNNEEYLSNEAKIAIINALELKLEYSRIINELITIKDNNKIIEALKYIVTAKNYFQAEGIKDIYLLEELPYPHIFAKLILLTTRSFQVDAICDLIDLDDVKNENIFLQYIGVAKIIANEKREFIVKAIEDLFWTNNLFQLNCAISAVVLLTKCKKDFQAREIATLILTQINSDNVLQVLENASYLLEAKEDFQARKLASYIENNKNISTSNVREILSARKPYNMDACISILKHDNEKEVEREKINIVNSSREEYNAIYARSILNNSESDYDYNISSSLIINEADDDFKANIIYCMLNNSNDEELLELAAIINTLHKKIEILAIDLISRNSVLKTYGVRVLLARIIAYATNYEEDIAGLWFIMQNEKVRNDILNAIKDIVINSNLKQKDKLLKVFNRVLNQTINKSLDINLEKINGRN